MCSRCRLVALAATLQPDAGTQQRQVMHSGLSLALRLGVPEQEFLQRLLDPQHGLTFYGEYTRYWLHSKASCGWTVAVTPVNGHLLTALIRQSASWLVLSGLAIRACTKIQ